MARVVDPVCGMEFEENVAADKSEWLNRTFYFCHPICKQIFDAKPWYFALTRNGKPKIQQGKSKIIKPNLRRDDCNPAA
jgi:YHS domain-containing protein